MRHPVRWRRRHIGSARRRRYRGRLARRGLVVYGSGSSIAIFPTEASSVIHRAQASIVGRERSSARSMRSSILAPSRRCSTIDSTVCAVSWSSSSHADPARPPRFNDPKATLPSSAPSRASSSRMSGVAMTPSTPGSASATIVRSRTSRRFAITNGWPEIPTMPRAGWSIAMMKVAPSAASIGRGVRAASAAPTASGRVARVSSRSAQRESEIIVTPELTRRSVRERGQSR
jgi:hypothetical protein